MKRMLVLIYALGVALAAGGANGAAKDPGGVFGLKWDQSATECKKKGFCEKAIKPEKPIKGETLFVGKADLGWDAAVQSATWSFYNGKVYFGSVLLKPTTFKPNFLLYREALSKLSDVYGPPASAGSRTATWVLGKTKITLSRGEEATGIAAAYVPTFTQVAKIKKLPVRAGK